MTGLGESACLREGDTRELYLALPLLPELEASSRAGVLKAWNRTRGPWGQQVTSGYIFPLAVQTLR
jgi:hypothetical protein